MVTRGRLDESAVLNRRRIKTMVLERLSGAVQTKHIKMSAWRKQVIFPNHLWYEVVCRLNDQGKWQTKPQQSMHICTLKSCVILLIPSIENLFSDDEVIFSGC